MHLALERWDCQAGGRQGGGEPPPQAEPGTRPSSRRLGSIVAQLQGTVADRSSLRRRKLWSSHIRELPQASWGPEGCEALWGV